jgi:hypothetical protein
MFFSSSTIYYLFSSDANFGLYRMLGEAKETNNRIYMFIINYINILYIKRKHKHIWLTFNYKPLTCIINQFNI